MRTYLIAHQKYEAQQFDYDGKSYDEDPKHQKPRNILNTKTKEAAGQLNQS
jgi:hypothetical protein